MELTLTARELAARCGVSLRTAQGYVAANRGTDAVVLVDVVGGNGTVTRAEALRLRLAALPDAGEAMAA